jgi:hypothetical protein
MERDGGGGMMFAALKERLTGAELRGFRLLFRCSPCRTTRVRKRFEQASEGLEIFEWIRGVERRVLLSMLLLQEGSERAG